MAERIASVPPCSRREFLRNAGLLAPVGVGALYLFANLGIDIGFDAGSPDVEKYYIIQFGDIDFYDGIAQSTYTTSTNFVSPRTGNAGTVTTASLNTSAEDDEYKMSIGVIGKTPKTFSYDSADMLKAALADRWNVIARTGGNVEVLTQAAVLLNPDETQSVLSAMDTTPAGNMISWEPWDINAFVVVYGNISRGRATRRSYVYVELEDTKRKHTLTIIVEPDMLYNLGPLAEPDEKGEHAGGSGYTMRNRDRIRDGEARESLQALMDRYTPE